MYLALVDNPSGANKKSIRSLGSSLAKKVNQFYEQDDNSRMSNGKHDTLTVVMNGRKEAVQESYLYETDELCQLFMEEYPMFQSVAQNLLLFDLVMSF